MCKLQLQLFRKCLGTDTEKEISLERKIEDLQQENESLHAGDVQQKYDYLQQKYDNLQQIFLTQTKKVSKLEGERADRSDLCCLERVCVCF